MVAKYSIRAARPGDEQGLFVMIRKLAEYEQLSHAVSGSAPQLAEDLFGPQPCAEALVAEADSDLLGFALFFGNYSTFLTRAGLYLEDIFVLPEHRRNGIGKALLKRVASLAEARHCGRLEWSVLDWNASAIAFYEGFGAKLLPDWRICRVTSEALGELARGG